MHTSTQEYIHRKITQYNDSNKLRKAYTKQKKVKKLIHSHKNRETCTHTRIEQTHTQTQIKKETLTQSQTQ